MLEGLPTRISVRKKPRGDHLFKKGHAPHPRAGRPPGSKDKFKREVNQALFDAIEYVGEKTATRKWRVQCLRA
jgi:hypothetical protein